MRLEFLKVGLLGKALEEFAPKSLPGSAFFCSIEKFTPFILKAPDPLHEVKGSIVNECLADEDGNDLCCMILALQLLWVLQFHARLLELREQKRDGNQKPTAGMGTPNKSHDVCRQMSHFPTLLFMRHKTSDIVIKLLNGTTNYDNILGVPYWPFPCGRL